MAEEQDQSQKTEEPTHKRLEEATQKGQVANSREIFSFFMMFVLTWVVVWLLPGLMADTHHFLAPFITRPHDMPVDNAGLGHVLTDTLIHSIKILALPFLAAIVAAVAGGLIQNPFNVALEPIIPKFEKISPAKGLARIFSMRSFVEFLKGIAKIILISFVIWMAVSPDMGHLKQSPDDDIAAFLAFTAVIIKRMLIAICILMFVIALLDFFYQKFEYIKSLRMTKQEVKDEYKQQEGDPIVKQRLKALRMEKARKRMMAAVPTADVVITNPTHYAVALKYDQKAMQAPILVAKGADNVALRIREKATEHDIPIVENPPLARVLYENVDLDKEIPFAHYKAVAEVISFVYRKRGRNPG